MGYDSKIGASFLKLIIPWLPLVQALVGTPTLKKVPNIVSFLSTQHILHIAYELVFSIQIGQTPKNTCIFTQTCQA